MDDIDKTFDRLRRIDYHLLYRLLVRNVLMTFVLDLRTKIRRVPSHKVVRFEQMCLENGWTMEEFVNEYSERVKDGRY